MTSNKLDVLREGSSALVTRADLRNQTTDSWTDVLVEVGDLASRIADTDFVPQGFRNNVPAVAATILQGREIGFPPMTSLSSLHSIKGRVGLAAEAMRALVLQAGHDIVTTESTSATCTMQGRRKGSEVWTKVTWTIADARQAGLLSGSGWKDYPRQMLTARASAELCRLAFPDVIRGLPSTEELEQYDVVAGVAPEAAPGGRSTVARKKAAKKAAAAPALEGGESAASEGAKPTEQGKRPSPPPVRRGGPPETDASSSATTGPAAGEAPDQSDGDESPDLAADSAGAEETRTSADPESEIVNDDGPLTEGQMKRMQAGLTRVQKDIKDRDPEKLREKRLAAVSSLIGREISTAKEMTFGEASDTIDAIESARTWNEFIDKVAAAVDAREQSDADEPVDADVVDHEGDES